MERAQELRVVAALRVGDEAAFAGVYDHYRARVFSFILRMVGRRAVAEELAQEVWMRLAVRARSLREDTYLEAWLFTVARNLCLSYWRTTAAEPFGVSEAESAVAISRDPPPDESAALRELHARLERGLARLHPQFREALLLVGVHGMTPGMAAVVCGVSAEAMRKRLERARDALARELGQSRGARSRTATFRRASDGRSARVSDVRAPGGGGIDVEGDSL